jgi:4-diphosphocytidyl-2-C-methyl-D-erythritol kinase
VRFRAHAKINLGLVVSPPRQGVHPIDALNLSVSWADRLAVELADEDGQDIEGNVPTDHANLAWRAVAAVRDGTAPPLRLTLRKHIPTAAGLGGGSADAAAALVATSRLLGKSLDEVRPLAPSLGSDVPYCLEGGLAVVGGFGEQVSRLPTPSGFAVAIAVPPFELSTAAVYRAWDDAGGPEGPPLAPSALPPDLRGYAPLRNDLFPAAIALRPELDEWRAELVTRWGRSVALTGSGPSLFGFFVDVDEAEAALRDVPTGLRATHAAVPRPRGWEEVPQ